MARVQQGKAGARFDFLLQTQCSTACGLEEKMRIKRGWKREREREREKQTEMANCQCEEEVLLLIGWKYLGNIRNCKMMREQH